MIKILHCADLHLDSPFSYENIEKAEVRRNELRGTFTSLMLYIKSNKIDLVLIAGDLFDVRFITKDTVALVVSEFAKAEHCRFVIAPGNHDPFEENSVYSRTTFPDNVYIFKKPTVDKFSFDDIGVDVYGYAFEGPSMASPISGLRAPRSQNRLQLLCAHADILNPLSPQAYLPAAEIERMGFDYIALGHIHNTEGLVRAPHGGYYGYCGCLEGRDYGECGYKGAYVAELEKTDGVLTANVRAQRFSRRRYETRTLDITGAIDSTEVVGSIQKLIAEQHFGDDTSLRITLEGNVSPELNLSVGSIKEQIKGLFSLELVDRSAPLYDYERLLADPTIKGAFFAELLPLLQSADEEERAKAALALRYGLAAIRGADLTGGRTDDREEGLQ